MKNQSAFTLIELAMVLVIIGLLLGGVMKGQELIHSARVKNLAADFKNVPVYIYGYQDKFKALPGDDANVATHLAAGTPATTPAATLGNGAINGTWDSVTETDESILFWQHVRLAGLAAGATAAPANSAAVSAFVPHNSNGGRIGVSSVAPIAGMTGSYFMCSSGIDAKYVLQLDQALDDGVTTTGSVQAAVAATASAADSVTTASAGQYTVCMSF